MVYFWPPTIHHVLHFEELNIYHHEYLGPLLRKRCQGLVGDRQRGSAMEGVGENCTRFFPGFLILRTRKKKPVKTRKKPVGKCGEYAEKVGDRVMS